MPEIIAQLLDTKPAEYDFTKLSAEEQLADIKADFALRIAAAKKSAADLAKSESDQNAATLARAQAVSAELVKKGYIGDGSLADYKTLFTKDLAKFNAGVENFFSGKSVDDLAANYRGDGTNALEKLYGYVQMYDR